VRLRALSATEASLEINNYSYNFQIFVVFEKSKILGVIPYFELTRPFRGFGRTLGLHIFEPISKKWEAHHLTLPSREQRTN
jgi:hypothetical protein